MPRREKTPEQIELDRKYRQMHLDLKELYLKTPRNELSDEDLLAVLLSYSMRKCDYRQAAHDLLEQYGSLNNLLDARPDTLLQTDPLRLNTVLMLKGIPALYQRARLEARPKRMRINCPENARTYLAPYFIGYNYEQAYLLVVSEHGFPKDVYLIAEGSGTSIYIDKQRILREGLMHPGCSLVLAHSHPGGSVTPSTEDKLSTAELSKSLTAVNIKLLDHLIFAGDDCYFLSADAEMDRSILAFSNREPPSIYELWKK